MGFRTQGKFLPFRNQYDLSLSGNRIPSTAQQRDKNQQDKNALHLEHEIMSFNQLKYRALATKSTANKTKHVGREGQKSSEDQFTRQVHSPPTWHWTLIQNPHEQHYEYECGQ